MKIEGKNITLEPDEALKTLDGEYPLIIGPQTFQAYERDGGVYTKVGNTEVQLEGHTIAGLEGTAIPGHLDFGDHTAEEMRRDKMQDDGTLPWENDDK